MKKSPLGWIITSLILLTTLTSNAQFGPVIKWQKTIGGSKDDKINDVVQLADGGFLLAGYSYSNDGDINGHKGSLDSSDAILIRTDARGNILWQKSVGGTGNELFNSIIRVGNDAFYAVGSATSNDGDITNSKGNRDAWVIKFTTDGTIIWSKNFGGSNYEEFSDGVVLQNGDLAIIGRTSSYDGDVTGFKGREDVWIVRINPSGNIVWQKCYGDELSDNAGDIIQMPNGTLKALTHITAGTTSGNSFQASNSTVWLLTLNVSDGSLISKENPHPGRASDRETLVNTSNNYWLSYTCPPLSPVCQEEVSIGPFGQAPLKCLSYDGLYSVRYAGRHGIDRVTDSLAVVAGSFHGVSGTGYMVSIGMNDAIIGFNGQTGSNPFHYLKNYGGTNQDEFNSVKLLQDNNFIIAAGYTKSNDFDVSGNHGMADGWLVYFESFNSIKGRVFLDANDNGIWDAGEIPFNDAVVVTSGNGVDRKSVPVNGNYTNYADTGKFTTRVVINNPYYTTRVGPTNNTFGDLDDVFTVDFPIRPIPGNKDYTAVLHNSLRIRPGFTTSYAVKILNKGTDTLLQGTLIVVKDRRTKIQSANPTPEIKGDSLIWKISNFKPYDQGTFSFTVKVDSIPLVNLNDELVVTYLIDSAKDVNTIDNYGRLVQRITGSYDPNDKQEANGGSISLDKIQGNANLIYKIRFQNTGNDTAFTVKVRDTLAAKLDVESIQMVEASHPYRLTVEKGNILVWDFQNINLVDSITNEPASNGFILFRIKTKGQVNVGDVIKNSAAIYFDFNPPVITNTHQTTITVAEMQAPLISGLNNSYCQSLGQQKIRINNLPASGSGITTVAKLDNASLTIAADSTFMINPSQLAVGAHTLNITFTGTSASKAVETSFTIVKVDTPDVNVTADITNITDLGSAVNITARNEAGGGSTPKYTFAKDRAITDILQAESVNQQYSLNPSTLAVGSNWIYVRMKTSSSCFSVESNVDSIKLERSVVTGITDPDVPGSVITIYPNPFSERVYVTGLKQAKKYHVTILTTDGRVIQEQTIVGTGKNEIVINSKSSGHYVLKLVDYNKKKQLGTQILIKR